jgi:hypothetical protein
MVSGEQLQGSGFQILGFRFWGNYAPRKEKRNDAGSFLLA